MRIIVEICSPTGYLRSMDINCITIFPKDNVRIKDSPEQDVLMCKSEGGRYQTIGFFGSTRQRDGALEFIKSRSSDSVVLDYNDWFTHESYDDENAIKVMKNNLGNFTMHKHMKYQIALKIREPEPTDAFKDLGILFLSAIKEDKPYFIEEVDKYSRLWAKCIYVPGVVTRLGVSPRQYFKYLIIKNNEKFK